VRVGALDAVGLEAQLVELDAPRLVEGEQRAGGELAIMGEEPLGPRRGQHLGATAGAAADERREGHLQRAGDLPQDVDGRRALAQLHLAEHGAAHAGSLGQALQRQALLHPQAPEVPADHGGEVRALGGHLVVPGVLPLLPRRGRRVHPVPGALADALHR
jgi:hypothetical protein